MIEIIAAVGEPEAAGGMASGYSGGGQFRWQNNLERKVEPDQAFLEKFTQAAITRLLALTDVELRTAANCGGKERETEQGWERECTPPSPA